MKAIDDVSSRHVKDRRDNFVSAFFELLCVDDVKEYLRHLSLLCNNPGRFFVYSHEISSEPKTKVPKIFLSYAENIKTEIDVRFAKLKGDEPIVYNYEIEYHIFNDTKDSMEQYSAYLKNAFNFGWKTLQNHRFYEIDPEMQTADFKMIIIYAKKCDNGDDAISRLCIDQNERVNWNVLIPIKATY